MKYILSLTLLALCAFSNEIAYHGKPEALEMSAQFTNIITLPDEVIEKPIFPKDKIEAKAKGRQIFVKFIPTQETIKNVSDKNPNGEILDQKIIYPINETAELILMTEKETYIFLLSARGIAMQSYNIKLKKASNPNKIQTAEQQQLPYIQQHTLLHKTIFAGATPVGYDVTKKSETKATAELLMTLKKEYTGASYTCFLFEVKNKTNTPLELAQSQFIKATYKTPLSIGIYYGNNTFFSEQKYWLQPFGSTKIVIVVQNDIESEEE